MNEVNNQISDLSHAFPPVEEDFFLDRSFSLQPDQKSNVGERVTQELPQVEQAAAHVDTLSNNESSHQKKKKRWTKMEDNQLFALKQQEPKLSYADIAQCITGKTCSQCSHRWGKIKNKQFRQQTCTEEEKNQHSMLFQKVNSQSKYMEVLLNPETATKRWTEEENKKLIGFQQYSSMPWEDVARQFPGKTPNQCSNHWYSVLLPRLQAKKQYLADTFPQTQKEGLANINGFNNQPINPIPAQNLNASESSLQTQFSDPFHAFPPVLEDFFPDNSFSLQPDQESNVEERVTQELPQVEQTAAHVAALSNNKSGRQKNKEYWSTPEDNQLFMLKQTEPPLSWASIAEHFPGKTRVQCSSRWKKLKQSLLKKQDLTEEERNRHSMILQELSSQPGLMQACLKPETATKLWTEEENKKFIELQQYSLLGSLGSSKDIARQFPGKTPTQCYNHWNGVLLQKLQIKQQLANTFPQKQKDREESHQQLNLSEQALPKKRKPLEEGESENDRPSKKARTQPASPFHEASQLQEDLFLNPLSPPQLDQQFNEFFNPFDLFGDNPPQE